MVRTIALLALIATGLVVTGDAVEVQPGAPPEFHNAELAAAYGKVAIVYGSSTGIWFAASSDSGRTFGERVKVADVGALANGHHRGPRLNILPDSMLVTATVSAAYSKNPKDYGRPDRGELTVWRSTDGGKTWPRIGLINDVPTAANEGLHSITADASGKTLFAVWLDKRAMFTTPGVETQLYGAKSTDGGRTWAKNVFIYASPEGSICQCCDPSVAIDSKGQINVMFRNVIAGSRDFYLTRSTDGVHFSTPEKLGEGTWKINGCPMDGGGLVLDHDQVVTAWRRESTIYLDKPGEPETRIADGKDVAITQSSKGTYLVWSTSNGVQALTPGAKTPAKISDEGTFPALVSLPDGSALAAWEVNGAIRVEKLP